MDSPAIRELLDGLKLPARDVGAQFLVARDGGDTRLPRGSHRVTVKLGLRQPAGSARPPRDEQDDVPGHRPAR
jgi:hypothetical protein